MEISDRVPCLFFIQLPDKSIVMRFSYCENDFSDVPGIVSVLRRHYKNLEVFIYVLPLTPHNLEVLFYLSTNEDCLLYIGEQEGFENVFEFGEQL